MALTQEQIDALPDTLTIDLPSPINHPDGTTLVDKIELREPTAGEIDEIAKKGSGIFAIALISGLPEVVVRKVPARPFKKAESYLLGFIEDARPTGPTS